VQCSPAASLSQRKRISQSPNPVILSEAKDLCNPLLLPARKTFPPLLAFL
jgi:hypothetical protein